MPSALTLSTGLLALAAGSVQAQYTLDTQYDSTNFFNEFTFFTEHDPTNGFVEYIDGAAAMANGLASTDNNVVHMGVDSVTLAPANGRQSVRVTSNKSYNKGLFIADIAHMPSSTCGSWPAFWAVGPNWPYSGEIDIIENVNNAKTTAITLHTSDGCVITNEGSLPDTVLEDGDCAIGDDNKGCGQDTTDTSNYGDGFNAVEGGVYAMEWTSEAIAIWFFARSKIPEDITSGNPDPASWGLASAKFNGGSGCNIDNYFKDNQLVFDTTFCGDWAGRVWDTNSECKALADTCQDYVSNNPEAFAESFWTVNSIKVYQNGGNTTSTPNRVARAFNA